MIKNEKIYMFFSKPFLFSYYKPKISSQLRISGLSPIAIDALFFS
jgi:hypothetical protein